MMHLLFGAVRHAHGPQDATTALRGQVKKCVRSLESAPALGEAAGGAGGGLGLLGGGREVGYGLRGRGVAAAEAIRVAEEDDVVGEGGVARVAGVGIRPAVADESPGHVERPGRDAVRVDDAGLEIGLVAGAAPARAGAATV